MCNYSFPLPALTVEAVVVLEECVAGTETDYKAVATPSLLDHVRGEKSPHDKLVEVLAELFSDNLGSVFEYREAA